MDKRQALRRMARIAFECFYHNCQDNGGDDKEIWAEWLKSDVRKDLRSLYRVALRG